MPKTERRKIPHQPLGFKGEGFYTTDADAFEEAPATNKKRAGKENEEAPQKKKGKVAEETPATAKKIKRAEASAAGAPQKKKQKVAKEAAELKEAPQDAVAELAAAEKALAEADVEWEAAAKEIMLAASDGNLWWDVDVVKADAERGAAKALYAARQAQDKMGNAITQVRLGRYRVQKAEKAKKDLVYAVKAAVPDHVRQSDIEAFLEPILHQELLTEFESMLTSQAEYYEDKFGQVSTRTHEMFSRLGSQGP